VGGGGWWGGGVTESPLDSSIEERNRLLRGMMTDQTGEVEDGIAHCQDPRGGTRETHRT